jgi:membrane protease YdiL (CAAX protease family)
VAIEGLVHDDRVDPAGGIMSVVRFPVAVGLTLGMLLAANLLANRVVPDYDVAVGLALVAGLTVVARGSGLTADELGLARRTWVSGLRWGGAAAVIVAAGYGIGAAIPAVRQAVADSPLPWQSTVVKALVVIPLATVIPEEFAFRGVLWALLRRESGQRAATAVSSALFGLWHVLPALAGGSANGSVSGVLGGGPGGTVLLVVGTVLFTGLAGVLFCELRARSGSLLAPILLHWAVNGLGELLLLVA